MKQGFLLAFGLACVLAVACAKHQQQALSDVEKDIAALERDLEQSSSALGTSSQIVGSRRQGVSQANNREYKGFVSIVNPHTDALGTIRRGHKCGGILIAPRVVLTAAHCEVQNGWVVLPRGSGYRDGDQYLADVLPMTYTVQRVINNNGFTRDNYENDIALLGLDRPVTGVNRRDFGQLSRIAPTAGTQLTFVGMGQLGRRLENARYLRKFQAAVRSTEQCHASGEWPAMNAETSFCAGHTGNPSADTCNGDSGSPVFDRRGKVVGVVAAGDEFNCGGGRAAVYTKVPHFISWITTNQAALMAQLRQAPTCPPLTRGELGDGRASVFVASNCENVEKVMFQINDPDERGRNSNPFVNAHHETSMPCKFTMVGSNGTPFPTINVIVKMKDNGDDCPERVMCWPEEH